MTAEQQARVTDLFHRVADTYDAVGVDFFEPVAAGLVAELAPQPGERALDVGCGRGAALFPLAEAVGPSGRVTGVDVAPGMVERTRADVATAGLERFVEVVLGDAGALDVPAASYDLVASSLVLFFLGDPLAALRSWHPALVDGGRIGVSTFGPFTEEWNEVERALRSHLPPEQLDARTNTGGPFSSDQAMEALLAEAGFTDLRTATATVEVRFDDEDAWYRWSMSHGQRQMWEAIPADRYDHVRAQAVAALHAGARPDGSLGFDQQIRYTLGRKG
jgi:ubiquinone/menaquinone biosynthesis C-methylase UbiE